MVTTAFVTGSSRGRNGSASRAPVYHRDDVLVATDGGDVAMRAAAQGVAIAATLDRVSPRVGGSGSGIAGTIGCRS